MKTLILFLWVFFLVFSFNLYAQDTLYLTVDALKTERIYLSGGTNSRFLREETIRSVNGNWFFKIVNPNNLSFKIIIRNNITPVVKREIPGSTALFQVKNNRLMLGTSDFIDLGSSISIIVASGQTPYKQYDLTCFAEDAVTTREAGQDLIIQHQSPHNIGIIYYDALYLNDPGNDPEVKLRILAFHAKSSIAGLPAALAGNRFLLPRYEEWSKQRGPSAQSLTGLISSALSAVGGLDVTNIADGIGRFIVRRAKTEMNIAFFDKFRQAIADTSLRDLQTLFPMTYITLNQIGDQIYLYDRYLQLLRESFETDLQSLPVNLPEIVENHPDFFSKYPWLLASLQSSFYIADGLMNHNHPGDIIAGYPIEILDTVHLANLRGSIQTLQLLSESLRDRDGSGKYWISEKQALDLVLDREALKIYIGLFRQHALNTPYGNIRFAGDVTLAGTIDRIDPDRLDIWYDAYKNFITGFIFKAGRVSNMISNWQKPAADSIAFLQYYRFSKASIDLVEQCTMVGTLPGLEKLKIKADLGTWFEVARSATDLALDVSYQNYSCALFKAVYIYDLIMVRVGKPAAITVPAENPVAADGALKTKDFLTKYGPFIAAMAQARTSDEVAQAIETAALPPGSARIKRETAFNVSLNAYVGPYVGYEQILDYDTTGFIVNSFGITAPVGISLSRGHSVFFIGTGKAGWSTSIFLSVIDLGAVASFRFKDDSTAQVPTIHLENIVSPGLFLSIGIPKWPVSVNFGAQMGPNLRTVTATTNDYSDKVYFRYSASVVVDIPIFSFYSKTRY